MKWLRYLSLLVFATICNGCLDVLMMSISVNDMAILNIQIIIVIFMELAKAKL